MNLKNLLFIFAAMTIAQAKADPVTFDFDAIPVRAIARVVLGDVLKEQYILDTETLKSDDIISAHAVVDSKNAASWLEHVLSISGYEMKKSSPAGFSIKKKKETEGAIVYHPKNRDRQYLMTALRPVLNQAVQQQPQQQDFEIESIVVKCATQDECARYKSILSDLDTPRAQVLIKAALYEIGTTRQTADGVGLAVSIMGGRLGLNLGEMPKGQFVMGIDAAGVKAAFQALDADTRVSTIARPEIRIASGSKGRVTVGTETPILTGSTTSTAGTITQQIQYKSSGVILTVSPAVYEHRIELDITQQLSGFTQTQTGVNGTPTLTTREVQTRVLARPGTMLVLGGLRSSNNSITNSVTRFLPDWMGRKTVDDQQTELVLVMWVELES